MLVNYVEFLLIRVEFWVTYVDLHWILSDFGDFVSFGSAGGALCSSSLNFDNNWLKYSYFVSSNGGGRGMVVVSSGVGAIATLAETVMVII